VKPIVLIQPNHNKAKGSKRWPTTLHAHHDIGYLHHPQAILSHNLAIIANHLNEAKLLAQ
jgi:hypothetical protein